MTVPFQYPTVEHVRRHGPRGYADYSSYRPWLRDEFSFRCVYCLQREAWASLNAAYDLDHFLPSSRYPKLELNYDNLLYACASCNSAKRDREIEDPIQSLLHRSLCVRSDGLLESTTDDATRIIWQLGLNLPRYVRFRLIWIEMIRLAAEHKPELYRQLMGYPHDLPELSAMRPPEGNTRPEGIAESHFERHRRGELPETY